jgi:hypothetical protein
MRRDTWLDLIVYRFQHQWETNPQYRAAVTGVIGLVVVLAMCSAMLLLSTTANSALAAIGLGTAANNAPTGTPNTGTKGANGYLQFQTPVVTYPPQNPPAVGTIPQSQTPMPGPTATDTPSATDTPPPGQQGSCNGGQGGISWSISPCPPVHGQTVTLTITSQKYAGATMSVEISVGTCSDGCSNRWQPTQMGGNGVWSSSWQLPQDASGPTGGSIIFNSGPTAIINGPTVQ